MPTARETAQPGAGRKGHAPRRRSRLRLFRTDTTETARLEAFSDGVLAIVITLLVLDIREPKLDMPAGDHTQWVALGAIVPSVLAWLLSFVTVLFAWIAHHSLFDRLARIDRGVLWLNGLFLLVVSFSPFPTAFLANHWGTVPATFFFSAVMLVQSLAFTLLRWYVSYPAKLFDATVPRAYIRHAMLRGLIGPALYATGALVSLVSPYAAVAIELLIPAFYFIPLPALDDA